MGKYDNHKEILFIQGIPQSSRFYLYIGSERSASQAYPFCWHADKMQDKGFQPACLFQWLDLLADMTDEIEIEVLQHGGNSVTILTSDNDSPNGSQTGEIAKILLVKILCIELVGRNKLMIKV